MTPQSASHEAPVRVGGTDDDPVHELRLTGPDGACARILTFGATIRDLTIPMPSGPHGVVLGFDGFDAYPGHGMYFGALVGRFANRIRGGRFRIDGHDHALDRNERGRTTLHGGRHGFGNRNWTITDLTVSSVTLDLQSPDGDQGFPGALHARCRYALSGAHVLTLDLTATTDRATPVSLCQHAYFNLDGTADLRHHSLQVFADSYLPLDEDQVPTGEIAPVDGTQYDLRAPHDLSGPARFDTPFALTAAPRPDGLVPAARLVSRRSGLTLDVATTKPGLQVYDGSYVPAGLTGLRGAVYGPRTGLCLETQFHPDSPNQPAFPDSILRPGQTYAHRTEFAFSQMA
jgi:aldose 1-epimerase